MVGVSVCVGGCGDVRCVRGCEVREYEWVCGCVAGVMCVWVCGACGGYLCGHLAGVLAAQCLKWEARTADLSVAESTLCGGHCQGLLHPEQRLYL